MFVNSLWASFLMFQQGGANGDVGWDLVTMWHNMGIPAKSRRHSAICHVRVVGRYHD